MPVKLTLEQVKEKLRLNNGNIVIESTEYLNKETPLKLRCMRCNHTWSKKAKMLNRKVICPICENSRLLSVEKIKAYVESNEFSFVSAVNLEDARKCIIEIICPNGHKLTTSWHSFAHQKCRCNKGICNVTGNMLRRNVREIISDIEAYGYEVLDGVDEYVNTKSQLVLLCKNDHRWSVSYNHFMKVRNCPDCKGFRRPYQYEEVKEIFRKEGCELLESEYVDNRSPLRYRCVCGSTRYKIRLSDFQNGIRCKRCANRETRSLEEIRMLFEIRGHTLLETEVMGSDVAYAYQCKCGNFSKIKIYNLLRGVRCMECYLESIRGENHPNYNADITFQERQEKRKYFEYEQWRKNVFMRDNYTCQCCGDKKGGNLVAHHLDSYDWCKEKRIDVNNGITLCEKCHTDFHKVYGYGGNTNIQFSDWMNQKNSEKD